MIGDGDNKDNDTVGNSGRVSATAGGFGRQRRAAVEYTSHSISNYGQTSAVNSSTGGMDDVENGDFNRSRNSSIIAYGRRAAVEYAGDSRSFTASGRDIGGFPSCGSSNAFSRGTSWGFASRDPGRMREGPVQNSQPQHFENQNRPMKRAEFPPPPRDGNFGSYQKPFSQSMGGRSSNDGGRPYDNLPAKHRESFDKSARSLRKPPDAFDVSAKTVVGSGPDHSVKQSLSPKEDSPSVGVVNHPPITGETAGKEVVGGFGKGRRGLPAIAVSAPKPASNIFSDVSPADKQTDMDKSIATDNLAAAADMSSKEVSVPRARILSNFSDRANKNFEDSKRRNSPAKPRKGTLGSKTSSSDMEFQTLLDVDPYKVGIAFKDGSTFDNFLLKDWKDANFHDDVIEHITDHLMFEKPTQIQSVIIPLIMKGHDLVCHSLSGSGKSTAVVLSLIGTILKTKCKSQDNKMRPYAIIISPTSKVANDTFKQCQTLAGGLDVAVACAANFSATFNADKPNLRDVVETPCDILCTTLDDLKRYLTHSAIFFTNLSVVMLEQAERIEKNFLNIIRFLRQTPGFPNVGKRQTLVFGSCITPQIHELSAFILKENFVFVRMKRDVPSKDCPLRYSKVDMLQALKDYKSTVSKRDLKNDLFAPLLKTFEPPVSDNGEVFPILIDKLEKEGAEKTEEAAEINEKEPKNESAAETVVEEKKSVEEIEVLPALPPAEENIVVKPKTAATGDSKSTPTAPTTTISSTLVPEIELSLRKVLKKIEMEKSNAQVELLAAENARLHERIRVLEAELTSVVNFFGNFLASANVPKYNSVTGNSSVTDADIDSPKTTLNVEKRS